MSHVTPRLDLPLLQPAQAQKHVTHNAALEILDAVTQLTVIQRGAETTPINPSEGDVYALGAAPTGDWAGAGGHLAIFANGGWLSLAPREGWRLWDLQTAQSCVFTAGDWLVLGADFQNIDGIGINTTSDAYNGLAVASPATLLTYGGNAQGHQLKINKSNAGATASLLFQTGWSGRAEMGTAGSDAFSIKVSADGAQFTTAMVFDGATGHASGAAVQNSASDTTPGRLMRADYGYGPGNILGTVGQTAGLPTGAVIETATTAQGSYVRFADGTQICSHKIALTYADGSRLASDWIYPMPFAGAPMAITGTLDLTTVLATATPAPDQIGALFHSNATSTQATASQYRTAGGTDFQSGDQADVTLFAVGRWF